ncbi:MAG: endonuclease [Nanoarchaeota archaeon]|nr:endonuclease [Nanoarchaeota archaeon]MBU4299690.1 endonuclease [Nanoarchaeota archaeon]MBU4451210.1 endonuclease [Nanoarchaeota archaeon]MCG2723308.1 endonuclease [archaeon]
MMGNNPIRNLYNELFQKYGKPEGQWKLWCRRPKTEYEKEIIFIEAILTQRTNWKNVELAMNNLRAAKITRLKDICNSCENDVARLGTLIKPAGFYFQKAGYLQNLAKFVLENYETVSRMQKEPHAKLREELLALKGIGPETADSILLYALEKPVFVIDEYTKRIARAKNLGASFKYHALQELFESAIEKDCALYQDFHALIVINGKEKNNGIFKQSQ